MGGWKELVFGIIVVAVLLTFVMLVGSFALAVR